MAGNFRPTRGTHPADGVRSGSFARAVDGEADHLSRQVFQTADAILEPKPVAEAAPAGGDRRRRRAIHPAGRRAIGQCLQCRRHAGRGRHKQLDVLRRHLQTSSGTTTTSADQHRQLRRGARRGLSSPPSAEACGPGSLLRRRRHGRADHRSGRQYQDLGVPSHQQRPRTIPETFEFLAADVMPASPVAMTVPDGTPVPCGRRNAARPRRRRAPRSSSGSSTWAVPKGQSSRRRVEDVWRPQRPIDGGIDGDADLVDRAGAEGEPLARPLPSASGARSPARGSGPSSARARSSALLAGENVGRRRPAMPRDGRPEPVPSARPRSDRRRCRTGPRRSCLARRHDAIRRRHRAWRSGPCARKTCRSAPGIPCLLANSGPVTRPTSHAATEPIVQTFEQARRPGALPAASGSTRCGRPGSRPCGRSRAASSHCSVDRGHVMV